VDSVSLISSVVSAQADARANQRQMAVAVNAARTEQATVDVLLQAIQTSAYGANGQVSSGAVAGTRFAASA
jgi:hypothetical protein